MLNPKIAMIFYFFQLQSKPGIKQKRWGGFRD